MGWRPRCFWLATACWLLLATADPSLPQEASSGPPVEGVTDLVESSADPVEVLAAAGYLRRLESLSGALRRQDWPAAKQQAEDLRQRGVRLGDRPLAVDHSLLALVEAVPESQPAYAVIERLEVQRRELVAVLDREVTAMAVEAPADAALLFTIGEEQRVEALRAAGRLPELAVPQTLWRNRFTLWLGERLAWVVEKLEVFVEWLLEQWRTEQPAEPGAARLDARLVTALVVILVLLIAWLAFRWLRGNRGAPQQVALTSESLLSQAKGDDNPLSREGSEWELYAEQLAAAGRLREAIRAWYHAVLVHLYRGGLLHYRKGRTNWEYVAALSAQLTWRSRFIELTRHFETEWYGRGASSEDALERCRRAAGEILDRLRSTPEPQGETTPPAAAEP